MNNKILVGVIAIVLVVLGGAYYASQKTDTATPNTSVSTGDSGSNVNSGSSSAGESLPPVETEVATQPTSAPAVTVVPTDSQPSLTPSAKPTSVPKPTQAGITSAEVAKHNSEASCWTIVRGEVFDVTSFMTLHPGGKANILKLCGIDGTSLFEGQHNGKEKPEMRLDGLKIGDLAK